MGLIWNWWGFTGLIAIAVSLAMAALVYLAAPHRPVNRWLALLLFVEGVTVSVCSNGIDIFLTDPAEYYGTQAVHATTVIALPFLYLIFMGKALDTPLVRPLKHRAAIPVLLGIMLALQVVRFVYRDQFVLGLDQPWFAPWGAVFGEPFVRVMQFWGAVSVFGFVAMLDAWRRARTDVARRRAKAYALAFGVRDVYWALMLLFVVPFHMPVYQDFFWGVVWTQSMGLASLAFVSLLGYGILKTHLFDLDLKVKWTVRQSTVAAAFIGVFFVVSESASSFFATEGGLGTYAGIGAAGLLVFAIAPLQRAADRVAHAAMPEVSHSPEYLTYRKFEVYKATVEGAYEDGAVTPAERSMLVRLRDKLGIRPEDATRLEEEVAQLLGAGPGAGRPAVA